MIKIIGGPHQGYVTHANLSVGGEVTIKDSKYTIRKFRTGKPKMHGILYAAPAHWDNDRCFSHLISLVEKL